MVINGIIRPPPEIRAVADRTASYVAKNGRAFEVRIMKSEKGRTPKFAFLQPNSPFHAYYEDRILFYESGGIDAETSNTNNNTNSNKNDDDDDDKNKKMARTTTVKTEDTTTSTGNKKTAPPPTTTTITTSKSSNNNMVRKKDRKQKASAMDPIARAILDQRSKIADAKMRHEKELKAMMMNEDNNNNMKVETEGEGGGDDDQKNVSTTTTNDDPSGPRSVIHHSTQNSNNNNNNNRTVFTVPSPPPLELVSVVAPANLSPTDLETIQLVAQFTALDGRGGTFLRQLTVREWNNPDFRFCQPRHGHFAYFTALVDSYRKIINDWTTAAAATTTTPSSVSPPPVYPNIQAVLADAAFRAEYEREMEERRSKQQQQEQEEGEIITIDWHDFVVVETIEFPVDEQVEVLATMLSPPPPLVAGGATATTTTATSDGVAVASRINGNEMEESDDDDDDGEEETIRVVPTYTPKVVTATSLSDARAIDPITGKSIPLADMPEHMRIQLLDPKWAEERKKFQAKQKDSNLVGGDAIVSNISRFAQGTTTGDGGGVGSSMMLDNNPKRRLEEANRIIRDQQQHHQPSAYPVSGTNPSVASTATAAATTSGIPPMHSDPPAKRQRMAMNLPPPGPPSRPPPSLPPITSNINMTPGVIQDLPPPTVTTIAPPILPSTIGTTRAVAPPTVTMDQPGSDMVSDMGFPTTGLDGDGINSSLKTELLSEDEFVKTLPSPDVTLLIRIPNDPTQMAWNFYGQIITLQVDVMTKVKDVSTLLSKQHLNNLAANKVQLINPRGGFLNNNKTLAELNIGPTVTLDMKTKQRGGRK